MLNRLRGADVQLPASPRLISRNPMKSNFLSQIHFPSKQHSKIFQYISNKIQRYVYLSLETALHVSGGNSTHHQEHTQLYLQHLVLVKPLLLPAAIVEELELQML